MGFFSPKLLSWATIITLNIQLKNYLGVKNLFANNTTRPETDSAIPKYGIKKLNVTPKVRNIKPHMPKSEILSCPSVWVSNFISW